MQTNRAFAKIALVVCACMMALGLAACGGSGGNAKETLANYPTADMSGYSCASSYDKEYRFADLSVQDLATLMDQGKSFAVYCGYKSCPWCNSMLNCLNDVAIEQDTTIAYIDTRKDASWQSNMDIADYDTFVELFGDALPLDDDGNKHLYVPHVFFVKNGKLVDDHPGTVTSQADANDPLTPEQVEELKQILTEKFNAL